MKERLLEALGPQIEHLQYGKGELIVQRLDETGGIHLLLSGVLLANQYARSGREVGYRRLLAGGYFGEISAIDGLPRSVNIVALEDAYGYRMVARHPSLDADASTELILDYARVATGHPLPRCTDGERTE